MSKADRDFNVQNLISLVTSTNKPAPFNTNAPRYAFTVCDRSMAPFIVNGDKVIVNTNPSDLNLTDFVVIFKEGEFYLRYIDKHKGKIVYKAYNENQYPEIIPHDSSVILLGRAEELQRSLVL